MNEEGMASVLAAKMDWIRTPYDTPGYKFHWLKTLSEEPLRRIPIYSSNDHDFSPATDWKSVGYVIEWMESIGWATSFSSTHHSMVWDGGVAVGRQYMASARFLNCPVQDENRVRSGPKVSDESLLVAICLAALAALQTEVD